MTEQNSEKLRYRSMLEAEGPVPDHAIKAYEHAIDQMLAHRDEVERLKKERDYFEWLSANLEDTSAKHRIEAESLRKELDEFKRCILILARTHSDWPMCVSDEDELKINAVLAKAEGASDDRC